MFNPNKDVPATWLRQTFGDYENINREDLEACYRIMQCIYRKKKIDVCIYAKEILETINLFNQKERDIIKLRFWDKYTLEQISKAFGVSRERIRQIQKRILDKIRPIICDNKDDSRDEKEDSIYKLQLSSRVYNALRLVNITTLSQLLELSENDLLKIRYLGKKGVQEIKEKFLKVYNIDFNKVNIGLKTELLEKAKKQIEIGKDSNINVPIEVLKLDTRTYNALKRKNIHTIGDLLSKTEKDILQVRNIGELSRKRMEERIKVLLDVDFNEMERFIKHDLEDDVLYMFNVPVEFLNLSSRSYNALKRKEIETIGELFAKIGELHKVRYLGKICIEEILSKLEQLYQISINKENVEDEALIKSLVYKESVDSLGISSDIINLLKAKGIITIGQLISKTEKELIKNYGIKKDYVKIIRYAIKDISVLLDLAPDVNSIESLGFPIKLVNKLNKVGVFEVVELKKLSCEELLVIEELTKKEILLIIQTQEKLI